MKCIDQMPPPNDIAPVASHNQRTHPLDALIRPASSRDAYAARIATETDTITNVRSCGWKISARRICGMSQTGYRLLFSVQRRKGQRVAAGQTHTPIAVGLIRSSGTGSQIRSLTQRSRRLDDGRCGPTLLDRLPQTLAGDDRVF